MGSPDISGGTTMPRLSAPISCRQDIGDIWYGIILINNEKTIFFRVSAVSESYHTERSRYHPLPISNDFFAVLLQIFTRFFVVTIMFCDFAAIIMFI